MKILVLIGVLLLAQTATAGTKVPTAVKTFILKVTTCTDDYADTDSKVVAKFTTGAGKSSAEVELDLSNHDDREKGKTDVYKIGVGLKYEQVKSITIIQKGDDGWIHCKIETCNSSQRRCHTWSNKKVYQSSDTKDFKNTAKVSVTFKYITPNPTPNPTLKPGTPRPTANPTPDPTNKPTTAKECFASYKGDKRNLCDTYEDVDGKDTGIERAINVIGGCRYEGEVRSIILIRPDDTWVFTTVTPKQTFDEMVKFMKDQSPDINSDHPLTFTHTVKSRDGKSRELIVNDDMSLWAAFLLQTDYDYVELTVSISTIAPSAQPTTGHPTHSPSTAKPTYAINSKIINGDGDLDFLNGLLKSSSLKAKLAREVCFRMSTHGTKPATFRTNCGFGKGPHMFIIKTEKGHIFGGYNDINWSTTSSYFYCRECFLWILKGREEKYNKFKYLQYRYQNYAIYSHVNYGPCYGGGHDMCISSPDSKAGYANTGYTYKAPSGGYPYYIEVSSGSSFKITDWEVYPVISTQTFYSRIVTDDADQEWVASLLPKGKVMGQRCYSMYYGLGHTSKTAAHFRNSCAARGPIMMVIKDSSGNVFGGYTGISWSKTTSGYAKSETAFLWILKNRDYSKKKLMQPGSNKTATYATYHHTSYGPCFGAAHDLCINAPTTPKGYGKVGYNYESPSGKYPYYFGSSSYNYFTISNWEVFIVNDEGKNFV